MVQRCRIAEVERVGWRNRMEWGSRNVRLGVVINLQDAENRDMHRL